MKILLTGSIGVGKTTLFNEIEETSQVVKIPEVARRVLTEAPDLRLNPYFQRALLLEQYFLESEAQKFSTDLIVCDRGYFDVIAYSTYFGIQPPWDLIKAFTPYDLIFYCDPEGTPPLPEGIPGVTPQEQEKTELDNCIRRTLNELNIPWMSLKGPTDVRLRDLYHKLNEYLFEIHVGLEGQPHHKER